MDQVGAEAGQGAVDPARVAGAGPASCITASAATTAAGVSTRTVTRSAAFEVAFSDAGAASFWATASTSTR